jgi:23S rRNA (uridine2552-2'-O)-methyltransferase
MTRKKITQSSQRWCQEHRNDPYVKQAQQAGYRSRAVYKLAQIHQQDALFRPKMTVVDLGAAPGGWSQWVKQQFQSIRVFALDILPMESLPEVTFIQGDFREDVVLNELLTALGEEKAHLVMSDMAPNITGNKSVDQPRAMLLAELARDFAFSVLAPGGHFLSKVFQGEGFDAYVKSLRLHFKQVNIRKPDASRSRSAEMYVLAKHYRSDTALSQSPSIP